MWPFSSKKRSRVAVFLHDGATWRVHVFASAKRQWRAIGQMTASGQNPRNLPEPLLDFADKQGARRVRVALPQNVHTLNSELPPDIEPEELQTALAFEMSGESGGNVEAIRVAAARAETFHMGAPPDMLLASSFEQSLLEQYAKTCQKAGLDFEGTAVLELAALAVHAQHHRDARLLFLRRTAGFYAVPGTELTPLSAGGVALGVREDEREADEERRERTSKRFKLHQALPLWIWCAPSPENGRAEQLRVLVGEGATVDFRDFDELAEEVARQVAETEEVGVPAGGGALAGPRPPEQDPHRAGTWLFFLVLLAALGAVGAYWQHLHTNLARLKEKAKALETIEQERKTLQGKLDALSAERSGCEETVRVLAVKSPLPPELLALLDALDRAMPEFTRVTAIEQDPKGGFLVRGHTAVQDRLNELFKGLLSDMGKLGCSVEPGGLSQIEGTTEYEFSYRIGPKAGKKP